MPDPAPDALDARPPFGPIEYRFPPALAGIRLARHVLGNWLEIQPGVDTDAIDDLLIVCSELCTNAVNHATGRAESIVLRCRVEGDAVVLEIEDDGAGFSWPNLGVIGDVVQSQEHGRGLYIVEAITDHVEVVTSRNRTIVRCTKKGVLRHAGHRADAGLSERFRAESHPTDTNR